MKRILHNGLAIAVALSCAATATAQLKPGHQLNDDRSTVFNTTVSPDIPAGVVFAGDKVSFDRLDMAERLDRELTSIIYGHNTALLTLKRANRHFPALAAILKEQDVPLDFLYLACTESMMDPLAVSPAHAAGIWQFLAATARQYGLEVNDEVDERYDPERSTVAACKYLKDAYRKYGHWATVAASYNAGMGRISSELGKQRVDNSFDLFLNKETSRYVFRIIAYKLFMEQPKRYGYKISRRQLYQPVACKTVNVSTGVASWVDWAREQGITYAQLREANPWIRSPKLTNSSGKTYKVKVPLADELYRSRRSYTVYNKNWTID